jgi:3-hydroxybutyryl-CoA dehydrogenase
MTASPETEHRLPPSGLAGLRVAVLGAGTMGSRIAAMLVRCDAGVALYDVDLVRAQDVVRTLQASAGTVVAGASLAAAVEGAHVVVEAASENLEVKHALLAEVQAANPSAVIASNTSTFEPSVLAAPLPHPERLAVAHFFNPADVVPLVELVPGERTAPTVLSFLHDVLVALGKRPVVLRQEVPGFVANRLQAAVLREALALVERGVVTVDDLDEIVRSGLGPRWAVAGPIRVADLGGLDIFRALCDRLFPTLSNAGAAPPSLALRAERGDLGHKSGSGYYEYGAPGTQRWPELVEAAFAAERA